MTIVPVIRRGDGVLISATPRGMWIEDEYDDREPVYVLHRHFEHYSRRKRIEYANGIVVAPVGEDRLLVTWPGYSPVYLTTGDLLRVGFAINVMNSTKRIREAING